MENIDYQINRQRSNLVKAKYEWSKLSHAVNVGGEEKSKELQIARDNILQISAKIEELEAAQEIQDSQKKEGAIQAKLSELCDNSGEAQDYLDKRYEKAKELVGTIIQLGETYKEFKDLGHQALESVRTFGRPTVDHFMTRLGSPQDWNAKLGALFALNGLEPIMVYRSTSQMSVMKQLDFGDYVKERQAGAVDLLKIKLAEAGEE